VLGERRELALLFKELATLKTDARLFGNVEELSWRGATDGFAGASHGWAMIDCSLAASRLQPPRQPRHCDVRCATSRSPSFLNSFWSGTIPASIP